MTVPERLIDAATRLFADKGYERVAVQEIVEHAGVTKGAMYHYFGSKDDLLHEIYGRLLRLQTEHLEKIASSTGPVTERLREAAIDVIVTSIDDFDAAKVFFRSMNHLSADKQKEVRAERRRFHEKFRGLIEEGQRDGTFRDDVPADVATYYFFGSLHQLGTWYRPDGDIPAGRLAEHYADLLIHSLRA